MSARLGIIVVSGTLDKVLPAFMLANTSASMGIETGMFFSFYGINVLHKERIKNLTLSTDGAIFFSSLNPGLKDLNTVELVGKTTEMIKEKFKSNKVPSVEDLIKQAIDLGVKIYPCNNALKMFGIDSSELFEGLENPVGASTFINFINSAEKSNVITF
ncbi:MAG: peroxiredoxin family protein [Persephonella sp.]|nr:MAG: peroxiredoxin family protein [Persephonella sp.]RUM61124.1 MAG: peroxiredoxin family protein [Persephonella sp.]